MSGKVQRALVVVKASTAAQRRHNPAQHEKRLVDIHGFLGTLLSQ